MNLDEGEHANALEALCTVLGQLHGNKAKGEFLLAEIEKHPEWLPRYLRQCYHPLRKYDNRIHAAVPHGLMARVFERGDCGELPPPPATITPPPAGLEFEITHLYEGDIGHGKACLTYDGHRVADMRIYAGHGLRAAIACLRGLGVTVTIPAYYKEVEDA